MSYDVELVHPISGKVLELDSPHFMKGGTYAVGGTHEATLNITYNYSKHFVRIFGNKGIHTINGMTGVDSIPVLSNAINKLGDDVSDDYWAATEGNAKNSLVQLLTLVKMRPDGIWRVE
jgi:hypothetical protein